MSRFQCLMTRSSRLILALSSASRSASQKAYRDKREARTKSKKKKVCQNWDSNNGEARFWTIIVDSPPKLLPRFLPRPLPLQLWETLGVS